MVPIEGYLDSDVMKFEELRVIHRHALVFLHHYTNSFKIVTIDEVLRENETLEHELT